MPKEWSAWILLSDSALRVGRVVRALASVALLVSFVLLGVLLATGRPIPRAHWLLVPGIPILIAGQLWGIATLLSRKAAGSESGRRKWSLRPSFSDSRRFFFDGLPAWKANVFLALATLGWIAGMTGLFALTDGGPTSPSRTCPYRLVDHGVYTCVSHDRYVSVAAAQERGPEGIFAAFFAIQAGMAAAELARRRKSDLARAGGF